MPIFSNFSPLLIITFMVTLVNKSKSQIGCGNPLTKLYDTLTSLGTAIQYNESHIECIKTTNQTCCDYKYYANMTDDFFLEKENLIDQYDTEFTAPALRFLVSYKEFLGWYTKNEAPLNATLVKEELKHFETIFKAIPEQKKLCFNKLWQHTGSMKCLVCNTDYNLYFKQLRNRSISMYFSEDMCQTIQSECSEYAKLYVQITEKAKYLFSWLRRALEVPSFSDAETLLINDYEKYIKPMYNCQASGLCRDLCSTFIGGTGYEKSYCMPAVPYFDWFKETFFTLQVTRSQAAGNSTTGNTTTATTATSRSGRLLNSGPKSDVSFDEPLLLGTVMTSHGSQEMESEVYGNRRVLETAYEKLQRENSNYNTLPIFSNSYSLNTFSYSNDIQNMTFLDQYRFSQVNSVITVFLGLVVGLVLSSY